MPSGLATRGCPSAAEAGPATNPANAAPAQRAAACRRVSRPRCLPVLSIPVVPGDGDLTELCRKMHQVFASSAMMLRWNYIINNCEGEA